jgi:hypothetical protein
MADDHNHSPTDEVVKELSSIGNWCYKALHEIDCLRAERDEVIRERDEARLEVCEWVEMDGATTAKEEAELRGWDCFKNAPVVKTLNGVVVSKGKAVPPKFDLEEDGK